MSLALVSRKNEAATQPDTKAAVKSPRIGEPHDSFEREADLAAEKAMSGSAHMRLGWSLSRVGMGADLQRRAVDSAGVRSAAPPIVAEALRSPGQPLDRDTRQFFERRFQHSLAAVRVHDDDTSATSAKAVGAHAYTVQNDIVFAKGRYRPNDSPGRRLLAHELAHTIQQENGAGSLLQRDKDAGGQDSDRGGLYDRAFAAADESRWEAVAELINGFSPFDLSTFIKTFKNEPEKIAQIYLGAIGNKKVGPDSGVAKATKSVYLDVNLSAESRKGNWSRAAYYANAFSSDDLKGRLGKLDSEKLKAFHEGAVDNAELGVDSGAAKISAEILASRSAKGDTKALILPRVKGEGKESLLRVMRIIDDIRPSPTDPGTFILTVDGQPQNITAAQSGDVKKKAGGVLRDHLQSVKSKATNAVDRYNGQSEVDRQHWLVAPIVKTLGRVKDPGPTLLSYGATAQSQIDQALAAIQAGDLTKAATLLAGAESSAISAQKMWQAYFEGIISAGEMTITVLEVTRDAAFVTLAILATIATGGAAASALGVIEGSAGTASAFGVGLGVSGTTAANVIAVGAPIVANFAEAGVKVAMGEKVDWGALVIDTAIQIIIARFGGRVTGGIAKALLGNPATESLAARVTEKVVHAAIMHVGSVALQTAAQDSYRAFKGQGITWQVFIDDLIKRLTDPKGLAIVAVTGVLTSAAQEKFAPAKTLDPAPVQQSGGTNETAPPVVKPTLTAPVGKAGAKVTETPAPVPDTAVVTNETPPPQKAVAAKAAGGSNTPSGASGNGEPLRSYVGGGGGVRKGMRTAAMPDVEDAPARLQPAATPTLSPSDQALVAEAEAANARLGKPLAVKTKSAAEEGDVVRSGFGKRGGGADRTKRVLDVAKEIGHELPANESLDSGVPGQEKASHAEKLAAIDNPGKPLAVDRAMCDDCFSFFQKLARARGAIYVVHEPGNTWVFRPDGTRVGIAPGAQVVIHGDGGGASAGPVK